MTEIRKADPALLQFLLMTIAGWLNRKQQDAIEYLKEETASIPFTMRPHGFDLIGLSQTLSGAG